MRIISALLFLIIMIELAPCIPMATNPKYVSVYDSGSVQPKTWPLDSIQSDSATHAVYADTADTVLHTPDSVRAAFKADQALTSGFSDSSRVSGISDTTLHTPDSVGKCDTANIAKKIIHGVDTPFIPFANTSNTYGKSIASYKNGEYINIEPFSTYFAGLNQTTRMWYGIGAAPNGDIYACVYNGDIYKQTGGSGNFVALGQTSRNWYDIACAPNGDIYASVYNSNGDIYKQTGGSGNFVALGQTKANGWNGLAAQPDGDIYACIYTGARDIYKQTGGTGDFVALGQSSVSWSGMAAASNGDVYACAANGDIYKQTDGSGNFVAMGQTSRNWTGMAAAPNGDIYACVSTGDVYKQTSGSGDFVATGQTSRNWAEMDAAPNGDIYASLYYGDIYRLTNSTIFRVTNGNTYLGGAVKIDGKIKAAAMLSTSDSVVTQNPDSSFGIRSVSGIINNIVSDSIEKKTDTGHVHDDRYYTETELTNNTIDLHLDSVSVRVIYMGGLPSGFTSDSCIVLKNGVPSIISASSFRVMIGAVSATIIADSSLAKIINGTPKKIPVFKSGNRIDTSGITYDTSSHYTYFPSYLLFDSTTYGVIANNTSDGYDNKSLLISSSGLSGNTARGSYIELFGNEHNNPGDVFVYSGDSGNVRIAASDSGATSIRGGYVDIDVPDTCTLDMADLRIMRDSVNLDDPNCITIQPVRSDTQELKIYGAGPNPGGSTCALLHINRGDVSILCDTFSVSSTWSYFNWIRAEQGLVIGVLGTGTLIEDITIDGDSLEITSGDTIRIYMPVVKRHE
jgi:uncharacterized Zn-binding protein involved in type VI secretion